MTNGVSMDKANVTLKAAVDILRACAAGAGAGPFALQIEARRQTRLFRSVREVARLVRAARDAADEHCRLLIALVVELIERGLAPNDRQLRALLLPIADRLGSIRDLPEHIQPVFRELCRNQKKDSRRPGQSPSTQSPALNVATTAKLLEGRSVVIIGGQPNPAAERKLKEAFHLDGLHWVETREHQSLRGIESMIGRPDVAVVALLIKLSSHSFGPQIQKHCRQLGTPLVRLKAGYNPNQVAKQILKQCGKRLQAKRLAEASE